MVIRMSPLLRRSVSMFFMGKRDTVNIFNLISLTIGRLAWIIHIGLI